MEGNTPSTRGVGEDGGDANQILSFIGSTRLKILDPSTDRALPKRSAPSRGGCFGALRRLNLNRTPGFVILDYDFVARPLDEPSNKIDGEREATRNQGPSPHGWIEFGVS